MPYLVSNLALVESLLGLILLPFEKPHWLHTYIFGSRVHGLRVLAHVVPD